MAIDKGYLMGIDQPVLAVFPERTIAHDLDRKRTLTVEHLLIMQSGLEWRWLRRCTRSNKL